ncbi:hypothetical protein Dsin_003946 [Dipteronia sinensis]|uniref:Uncharacterized protein n=1 Tax=Dipteronia sinensis TaxID=43782 RepID=A0AAE0B9V9_9ROSI|nr:hypothetical protein Dsin_003946 [Dipteronia sinensis]
MKMREADLGSERRQVFQLQNQITELETHVSESDFEIESMTCLCLMAEKDEVTAKVSILMAEASSRDDHIRQMEDQIRRLHMEHTEIISGSETVWKLEEKREAIRQLCFSLAVKHRHAKKMLGLVVVHDAAAAAMTLLLSSLHAPCLTFSI